MHPSRAASVCTLEVERRTIQLVVEFAGESEWRWKVRLWKGPILHLGETLTEGSAKEAAQRAFDKWCAASFADKKVMPRFQWTEVFD